MERILPKYAPSILPLLIRFESIAKRGIIARWSYNTSFGLSEKLRKGTFFNVVVATQKVA